MDSTLQLPNENLTTLTKLDLTENRISDLRPLEKLTALTSLDLGVNDFTDISPLEKLTALTNLELQVNDISDITPLLNNPGLGEGDRVNLFSNRNIPAEQIEALRSKGVIVKY